MDIHFADQETEDIINGVANIRARQRLPSGPSGAKRNAASSTSSPPPIWDTCSERADAHLPMIHLIFSNLKTWIQGTHHGISQQHLQTYLNEYVFRFNRRFYPMTAFNSVLGIAVHTIPPTYAELYAGERNAA